MNNILSYSQYRDKVRLYESMIIQQETESLNEGIVDKIKDKISTSYVDNVLKEEIELGKQVEERIKTTMEELSKVCDSLNIKGETGSKFKKSLSKVIDEINKTSFDTLSLLGDSKVDFAGFKRSAVMANIVNISVLLSPIKNALMLRRAYKYFIGLVKQSLRRDLIMLLVNFDQFQNMILQKSLESEENARLSSELQQAFGKIETMYQHALSEAVGKKSQGFMDKIKKAMEIEKSRVEMLDKHNPMAQFFMNSYDNTYKQTAETLKQLVGDDNQKLLDAHKNSISKLSHGDDKLAVYGELLISAAEEKSLKTSIAIHTNFLKIAEVFKLSNQKKLVEMMQTAEKEYQDEISKLEEERKKKESEDFDKKVIDLINNEGKKLSGSVKTFDDFDNLKGDIEKDDVKISKKEVLKRWYMANGAPDALKVVLPLDKYDSDYSKCYLSYLDILVDKVHKMFLMKDPTYKMSFDELDDKSGEDKIKDKFSESPSKKSKKKIKDEAKKALKVISDDVVKFDYELLLDKLIEVINNGEVTLNGKAIKELSDAIDYMKKYKDNDYSSVNIKEKSED